MTFQEELLLHELMETLSMYQFEILIAVSVIIVTTLCTCGFCCLTYMKNKRKKRALNAAHRIVPPRKSGWEISKQLAYSSIGVRFNQWKYPVTTWGPSEPDVMSADTYDLDIRQTAWENAKDAVDSVLDMFKQEIAKEACRFSGLQIGEFIRQGSSREGLKVSKADEFDTLLLFSIKGMTFQFDHIKDRTGWIIPEFGQLVHVALSQRIIENRYPTLHNEGVFSVDNDGNVCLNSQNLHKKVFLSIIMRAANSIEDRVNTPNVYDEFSFRIRNFSMNPPSINIQIILVEKTGNFDYSRHLRRAQSHYEVNVVLQSKRRDTIIDVDIVPGLELVRDVVPDPCDWQNTMECPRYAVFKWFSENQPSADSYNCQPSLLWRLCSSGYEKHVLDASHGSREQCYIVTALRIMKNEFRHRKKHYNYSPQQVVTVLRSYYLKHIAFYCILYLTVINKVNLSGVRESLAYFLEFLQVCLEEQRLPHFFHSNPLLVYMFPDYHFADKSLQYNLFERKSTDALRQANLSFTDLKKEIRKQFSLKSDQVVLYPEFSKAFREFVNAGRYS